MMVSVSDLRAAKQLSAATWDSLSPEDRQYAHSLLGSMYHYYDDLATYSALANGRIEQLREGIKAALDRNYESPNGIWSMPHNVESMKRELLDLLRLTQTVSGDRHD